MIKPFAEPGTYGCIPLWACYPKNIILLPTGELCSVRSIHDESNVKVLNMDIGAEMVLHKNLEVINLTFLTEKIHSLEEKYLG